MASVGYKQLEKEYARFTGNKYAVSCNTGTSALHLGLLALGIGKGDEVIVPEFTMAACAFAVAYTGAKPVFVDCDDTLNIDVSKIEKKITKRTRAIMPVHIYGRLCNMKEVLRIAKKHKLKVIEDGCEAQGAIYKSQADLTCYSFFKNKIIHAEEGGVVTTDNKKYADKINYLKNMAFDEAHTYFHNEIGFNYRMTDSQANMALESLRNVKKNLKRRQEIADLMDGLVPKELQMPKRDVVWVYDVKIPYKQDKFTRHFFKPMSVQTPFKGKYKDLRAHYYSQFMYLQVWEDMNDKEIRELIKRVV